MNKFSVLGKVIIILLFVFFSTSVFLYIKLSRLEKNKFVSEEIQLTLEEKISKIVVLPEEEPTIFQITNTEQIKNEPFFINAKIGDSVLVYTNAKKAFLYRGSENKIVDIAPIILQEEVSTQ